MALPLVLSVSLSLRADGVATGEQDLNLHVGPVDLQGKECENQEWHDKKVDSGVCVSEPGFNPTTFDGNLPADQRLLLFLGPCDLLALIIAPAELALGQVDDVLLVGPELAARRTGNVLLVRHCD